MKLITQNIIERWLSEDIRRPIWYPLSDFIATKKNKKKQETSKRSS